MALISEKQTQLFEEQGFLHIPNFYDIEKDLLPLQKDIYEILQILLKANDLKHLCSDFSSESFDAGYAELIAKDRKLGGIIYDAVKQVPAFIRLVAHPDFSKIFKVLRVNSQPGIAGKGFGIRIDNPGETQYQAPWHQDYLAQLKSPDGLVFWSPLITVSQEMGPVEFCLGSHQLGPLPVYSEKEGNKQGAYALRLHQESEYIDRCQKQAPLATVGDLIVIDFLTIHRSGVNLSSRSRWSLQIRYFNFLHPFGINKGWPGLFGEGKALKDYCPELMVDAEKEYER